MALALVAACTSDDEGGPDDTVQEEAEVQGESRGGIPRFEPAPCSFAIPAGTRVDCGFLVVKENRRSRRGPNVRLAVARIHARSADPLPDPVILVHGGPGAGVLAQGVAGHVGSSSLDERDFVIYDQRGTGLSRPVLNCPEREDAILEAFSTVDPVEVEHERIDASVAACRDRLLADGIDLNQYNSEANAADLNDLRKVLEYGKVNLLAGSYGTRVALTAMRRFPDNIRSVVLDAPYPVGRGGLPYLVAAAEAGLEAFFQECLQDPVCSSRHPDSEGDLERAMASFDQFPHQVAYTDPSGRTWQLHLTGDDLAVLVWNALFATPLIVQLPLALRFLAAGWRWIISLVAPLAFGGEIGIDDGTHMAVDCADNTDIEQGGDTSRLMNDPGIYSGFALLSVPPYCDTMDVDGAPADFQEPFHPDIPALVVSGELDPISPLYGGQEVADMLPDSVFIEVPRAGHVTAASTPCTGAILSQFWYDLTDVDTSCVADMVEPPFS